jgi:predicted transcriptional regulator
MKSNESETKVVIFCPGSVKLPIQNNKDSSITNWVYHINRCVPYSLLMKNRSRSDIIRTILESANGGAVTKTKIMYSAFLSYQQLKEYLTILQENELLEYQQGERAYRTTNKGMQLLQLSNKIDELTPNIRTEK